jgi:two-component system chemotaxis sensor kinase CheA
MDDLITDFLVESFEIIERVDMDLLELERGTASDGTLASIFRGVHTIKGTCGFLGMERLEKVAHVGENVLSRLRDGELKPSEQLTTTLLHLVDRLRDILTEIAATGEEPQGDDTALLAELNAWLSGEAPAAAPEPAAPAAPAQEVDDELAELDAMFEAAAEAQAAERKAQRAAQAGEAPAAARAAIPTEKADDSARKSAAPSLLDQTVRLDVSLLDRMMNLVGELVLTRNRVLQQSATTGDADLISTAQHLDRTTSELQECVMKTRLQPLSVVWNKLPRVVRDVSSSLGKEVELIQQGEGTELDKAIIEAIKDPFTHIVRNALDHGIEAPDAREAAGKPRAGTLRLTARQEGGQVLIEIADDGKGIAPTVIKNKAVEKGVVTPAQAAEMADRDALMLIFAPGFSTAAQVTNVSGRGVGMDVVRTHIEKLGGTVEIQSVLGQGTTLVLRIPLTLAIVPALTVGCGEQTFALPQSGILEIVGLTGETGQTFEMHGAPMLRLRNRLLPLLPLRHVLGISNEPVGAGHTVVVCQSEGRSVGVVVDGVQTTQEIVVKPLGKWTSGVGVYAGATILGDGNVSLILDLPGLLSKVTFREDTQATEVAVETDAKRAGLRRAILVSAGRRKLALPLERVLRLEEVDADALTELGGQEVIPYRGGILPLVRVSGRDPSRERLDLVVCREGEQTFGLVVDAVHEVDDVPPAAQTYDDSSAEGAVLSREQVTEWLNLKALAATCRVRYDDALTLN